MKMSRRLLLCFVAFFAMKAAAQEFRATLSGQVVDSTSAAVEGARVLATSVERNVPYPATTNASGRYVIQSLLPGKYVVTVEKEGFKKYVRSDVSLLASDQLSLDVRLELGGVAESITVTGEVPTLQTESATTKSTFENKLIEDVPSGGRNIFALMYNQPGVVKTSTYWGSMELYASSNVNGVSIGGGVRGENETVLDGVANTRNDRGISFVPSINSTQEFTVQSNSYDAQFGRTGGGVTMITLKSGTNQLHGQLFEYFKNEKLRTNDWVANKEGETEKTPFKNNTFGFELDGPIFIPKVFDGRNKAFFMVSLESLQERALGGERRTLPTTEQLRGDFSQLRNGANQLVTIYDPLTTRLGADGKTYERTAFPGNVIPASRINPIAAKVASFYPAPNLPGDGPQHINNYAKRLPTRNNYNQWLGKFDYSFSDRSRVSGRYGETPWSNYSKLVWGDNPAEPSAEYPSMRIFRNWGADWTYTVSPSVVFNLRGGLARYEGLGGNSFGAGYDPAQLGFSSSLTSQFYNYQFPRFNMGTYSELGANNYSDEAHDTWSVQPNVTWIRGRHFVKIGTEFRRYNDNNRSTGYASGMYGFTKGFTQANPERADSASGNEFASFLLGYPANGQVDKNIFPAYRSHYYSAYLQDDFKVSSKLTLNLGLRWDYETPRYERYDRMIRGFAFDQASPIATSAKGSAAAANCPACQAGLMGGLLYADSDNRYAFEPKKSNWQPRVGVAYRMRDKLVFRGGYGLSYLGQSANGQSYGYSRTTPLVSSTDGDLTPAVTLSNPYPSNLFSGGQLLEPIGNTQGLATNLGQSISAQYLDRPLPYSHQYSAGFQYSLGSWVADAMYVGNITRRLPVSMNLNFIPGDVLNSIPVDQRQAYFTAQMPNPMAGLLPGTGINGATTTRAQLLYAYPQYGQVTITDVPVGRQRYDSAQFKLVRRMSSGLTMTVAYTIAKTLEQASVLNAQDVQLKDLTATPLEKRLIQFDVPQQLSIIGSYDLPFGKGRRFASGMNRWANGVLGGWTVSGVWMSHSGYPIQFPNASPLVPQSAKFSDAQRDSLAQQKGRPQYDISEDIWFDTSIFPRTARNPYVLQNYPTRFPDVRTKPLNISDISVYKEFRMNERVRLQVRADAHNVGNFPWFGNLDSNGANVSNAKFGFMRADMGNDVRVVVGVMKLFF
jgi:hypothetical protein